MKRLRRASLGRHGIVLAIVRLTFVVLVVGILKFGWDFDQMSALFFVMGVLCGTGGGLGVSGTAAAFADGFGSMAGAAMLIGFARAISVVLEQGQVLDTIVHGLFTPIAGLPSRRPRWRMAVMHAAIHVPVPSVSGQAVLTMPILVPLSDLLGLSRQMTVLAYEVGAGLCELLTPTNGGADGDTGRSGRAVRKMDSIRHGTVPDPDAVRRPGTPRRHRLAASERSGHERAQDPAGRRRPTCRRSSGRLEMR